MLTASHIAAAEIVIRGVEDDMAKSIKRSLSLGEECSLAKWAVRYRFNQADQEIGKALQSFGYYSPNIDKSLSIDEECWRAEFHIDPGQPVRFRNINIRITGEGAEDETFDNFVQKAPLSKDATFDHEVYEGFKSKLEEIAAERGYFNATFTEREVNVSKAKNTADVNLAFDTASRFKFGAVSFDNPPLTDELMQRYIPFNAQDPYEASKIGIFYRSLYNSEYFDDVIIDTNVDEGSQTVPVDVRLIPTDPRTTRVAVGFSTDIGPRASLSYKNRLLNERGHRFQGNLSVAPVKQEAGAAYRIPGSSHQDGWNTFYGGFLQEETDTSESIKSTIGFRQLIPRKAGWFETRFIEITDDQFEIADETSNNFSIVPGISWKYTTSSSAARPPSAHRLELEVSGTSEAIGSTTDYANVVLKGKIIRPLWSGARIISRTRLGATFSDEFDRLPPSVRFFSGGDDSVRGFDFESIGPVNDDGEVIGGNRVLEASIEIDQLVREKWAIAVFMDAGNATLNSFGSDLETAAGIGVRWYSPLGPLRVDLAAPVNSDESGVRFHISFGPDV